ncbi:MAG TPA: hypothetical protein VKD91_01165, partial [Pyrinomonadaceae bacterium]|nr:hypothetical protein [Pyrinomonadaceae bacterium]
MNDKEWYAAEVVVAPAAREAIEYGLMEAGAQGTETRTADKEQIVTGYFDRQFDEAEVRAALLVALQIYQRSATDIHALRGHAVPVRDWLAEWKKT